MKNHLDTPGNSLTSQDKDKKILSFLKAVPHLEFTSTGINNIARRFSVTPEHLFVLIDLVRKGGQDQ